MQKTESAEPKLPRNSTGRVPGGSTHLQKTCKSCRVSTSLPVLDEEPHIISTISRQLAILVCKKFDVHLKVNCVTFIVTRLDLVTTGISYH